MRQRKNYNEKNARDKENIIKYREGDEDAGNALVKEYLRYIKSQAYLKAQKSTQEVNMEEFEGIGLKILADCIRNFDTNKPTSFASYFAISLKREFNRHEIFCGVVVHADNRGIISYDKHAGLTDDGEEEEVIQLPDTKTPLPDALALSSEVRERVDTLPEPYKRVIVDVFFEEKSIREISVELDMKQAAVREILRKALIELKKKLVAFA